MKKWIISVLLLFLNLSYSFASDDMFQKETDKYFKQIDKKIENYLGNLNKSTNHCFWKDKKQNFVECIDDIEKNFDAYSIAYSNACKLILSDTIDKSEKWYIPATEASKFIDSKSQNLCTRLYEYKIRIYKLVAHDILKENKLQILKDENKLFVQEQRDKYSDLLNLIRVNIWYIERIWKKWPSKTKK